MTHVLRATLCRIWWLSTWSSQRRRGGWC
jgi:hypothetical protein